VFSPEEQANDVRMSSASSAATEIASAVSAVLRETLPALQETMSRNNNNGVARRQLQKVELKASSLKRFLAEKRAWKRYDDERGLRSEHTRWLDLKSLAVEQSAAAVLVQRVETAAKPVDEGGFAKAVGMYWEAAADKVECTPATEAEHFNGEREKLKPTTGKNANGADLAAAAADFISGYDLAVELCADAKAIDWTMEAHSPSSEVERKRLLKIIGAFEPDALQYVVRETDEGATIRDTVGAFKRWGRKKKSEHEALNGVAPVDDDEVATDDALALDSPARDGNTQPKKTTIWAKKHAHAPDGTWTKIVCPFYHTGKCLKDGKDGGKKCNYLHLKPEEMMALTSGGAGKNGEQAAGDVDALDYCPEADDEALTVGATDGRQPAAEADGEEVPGDDDALVLDYGDFSAATEPDEVFAVDHGTRKQLDSACTTTCFPEDDTGELRNVRPHTATANAAKTGATLRVTGKADWTIRPRGFRRDVTLTDVLISPDVRRALVSEHQLAEEGDLAVRGSEGYLLCKQSGDKAPVRVENRKSMLYNYAVRTAPGPGDGGPNEISALDAFDDTVENRTEESGITDDVPLRRSRITKAIQHARCVHFGLCSAAFCVVCAVAGAKHYRSRRAFAAANEREEAKPDKFNGLTVTDALGPRVATKHGARRYGYYTKDKKTGWRELHTTQTREKGGIETIDAWKRATGKHPEENYSDCATELCGPPGRGRNEYCLYCDKIGVKVRDARADPSEKGEFGDAESELGALQMGTRAVLYEGGLPAPYWNLAAKWWVFVRNRLVGPNETISAYEARFGKAPSLKGLRIFGSRCLALPRRPAKTKKIYDQTVSGIFLGVDPRSKSWLVETDDGKLRRFETIQVLEELHTPSGGLPFDAQRYSQTNPVPDAEPEAMMTEFPDLEADPGLCADRIADDAGYCSTHDPDTDSEASDDDAEHQINAVEADAAPDDAYEILELEPPPGKQTRPEIARLDGKEVTVADLEHPEVREAVAKQLRSHLDLGAFKLVKTRDRLRGRVFKCGVWLKVKTPPKPLKARLAAKATGERIARTPWPGAMASTANVVHFRCQMSNLARRGRAELRAGAAQTKSKLRIGDSPVAYLHAKYKTPDGPKQPGIELNEATTAVLKELVAAGEYPELKEHLTDGARQPAEAIQALNGFRYSGFAWDRHKDTAIAADTPFEAYSLEASSWRGFFGASRGGNATTAPPEDAVDMTTQVDDYAITGQHADEAMDALCAAIPVVKEEVVQAGPWECHAFNGLEVLHSRASAAVLLSQQKYIAKVLKLHDDRTVWPKTPRYPLPNVIPPRRPEDVTGDSLHQMRVLRGALNHTRITQLEIIESLRVLGSRPGSPEDVKLALHVVAYLRPNNRVLEYTGLPAEGGNSDIVRVNGLADASFATEHDLKSVSGKVVRLGADVVSVGSKRQADNTATGTPEAELIAGFECYKTLLTVQRYCEWAGFVDADAVPELRLDARAATDMCNAHIFPRGSRWFGTKVLRLREANQQGEITVKWVPRDHNLADGFTHPLRGRAWGDFVWSLGMRIINKENADIKQAES